MPTHQFGIEQTDIHTRMKWKKCMKCGQVMVERDDYFNMHCQAAQKEIEGWLVDEDTSTGFAIDGGKWTQKQVHDKSRDALRTELRARLAEMKGKK